MDISPIYRDYPVSYLTIAIVCCGLFYYIWLHLEFVKAFQGEYMAQYDWAEKSLGKYFF